MAALAAPAKPSDKPLIMGKHLDIRDLKAWYIILHHLIFMFLGGAE